MIYGRRIIFLVLLLAGINLLTDLVLYANLRAGVYRPDADSISVPAVATLLGSLVAGLFAFAAGSLPHIRHVVAFAGRGRRGLFLAVLALVLLDLPPLAVVLAAAGYWLYPHHYLISAGMLVVFLALAGLLVRDVRSIGSVRSDA